MHNKKRIIYKIATVALVATLGLGVVTGCSKNQDEETSATPTTTEAPSSNGETGVVGTTDVAQYLNETILTMDGTEYTLQDLMYIIYNVEANANDEAMWAEYFGDDYWDGVDSESGMTGRELVKENIIETAKMAYVLYEEAKAENITLSEEYADMLDEELEYILESMSEEYIERTGFTETNLREMLEMFFLASEYYNDQVEAQEVDEAAIRSEFDYEDYRQSEIEYIALPTVVYDEDWNVVDLSAEEIEAARELGERMLAAILSGQTLEEASELGDEEGYDYVEYGSYPTADPEEDILDEAMIVPFSTLSVGDTYGELIQGEEGFYIIHYVTDESTEEYDMEIEDAILGEKEYAYQETYDTLVNRHTFEVNEEVWSKIEIGNLAFEPYDFGFEYEEDEYEEDETVTE